MNASPVETIAVKPDEDGIRLDRWFRIHFPQVGYTYLQKLLRSGQVRVNSKRVEARDRLQTGQEVRVPAVVRQPPKSQPSLKPPMGVSKGDRDLIESIILFEDEHVLILNKPFGLAVQGGTGTKRHIDGILMNMADRFMLTSLGFARCCEKDLLFSPGHFLRKGIYQITFSFCISSPL